MKVLDVLSTVGAMVLAATPLAVAGAAHAQAAPAAVSIQVGDLDFSNRADVTRFDARVSQAADRFCDGLDDRDLSRRSACVSDVRDEAVSQLGAEQRGELAAGRPMAARIASAQ